MISRRILLFLALIFMLKRSNALSTRMVTMKDFDKIRLDEKGFNKTMTIHYNWYVHSIKALMGQMGRQLMRRLNKGQKRELLRCLDRIEDKRDIVSAGRCLVTAKKAYDDMKTQRRNYAEFQAQARPRQRSNEAPAFRQEFSSEDATRPPPQLYKSQQRKAAQQNSRYKQWMGAFRTQRRREQLKALKTERLEKAIQARLEHFRRQLRRAQHKRKSAPRLRREYKRQLASLLRARDPREDGPKMGIFRRRVKRSPHRLIADGVSKSDSHKFTIKRVRQMPSLKENKMSPVQKLARSIMKMVKGQNETAQFGTWSKTYKDILDMKRTLDAQAKQPGAKVYDLRMYDLVLGRDSPSESLLSRARQPGFIAETFGIVSRMNGAGGKNLNLLSPRFASVMPDKSENRRGVLSPSILSFYRDDSEDQIMPLPKLLETTGLDDKDREAVLEMIMDVSGAKNVVDDAMKVISNMNLFGMEGEFIEVTRRVAEIFERFEKTFTGRQNKEMKRRGFTFALPHQIEQLHTEQGILNKDHGFDYEGYKTQSRAQKEEALWLRIQQIALNHTELSSNSSRRRVKRQNSEWLSVLAPTVLAPYSFTIIKGLVVLGPVVLSPSLFSPLLLNPAVLSPYVLSPAVGMPFILSPYLLSPYVLSPLIMAPFILNPYFLSPNVINPYVLSPLILSPLVLCPDVLSPMVLGGSILSPSVLSPSIYSPSTMMANVLSPSFLS